jgi:hypothetical protein
MATHQLIARDAVIRQAAFDHVRALQSRDLLLSHEDIARSFVKMSERWPLGTPAPAPAGAFFVADAS